MTDEADRKAAETQALLKILELGDQQIKEGKTRSVADVRRRLEKKYGRTGGS